MALPADWAWIEDLIEEEGRAMTFTVPGAEADVNKPWRGNTAGTPTAGTGVMVRYRARANDTEQMKRATQKILIIPNESVDIEAGTKVTDSLDSSDWMVTAVEKISNKSDILLYILYVRQ